jgi:hypothetical protein
LIKTSSSSDIAVVFVVGVNDAPWRLTVVDISFEIASVFAAFVRDLQ